MVQNADFMVLFSRWYMKMPVVGWKNIILSFCRHFGLAVTMLWVITDRMAMCTVIHGTYFYLTASKSTAQIRVSSLGRRLNPNRLAPASRLPAARDATTTSSLRQHDVGDVAKKYRTQIVLIEQSVLATLCSITGVICLATMTFGRGVCFKAEFSCALSFATKW